MRHRLAIGIAATLAAASPIGGRATVEGDTIVVVDDARVLATSQTRVAARGGEPEESGSFWRVCPAVLPIGLAPNLVPRF